GGIAFAAPRGGATSTLTRGAARLEEAGRPRPRGECSRELPPLLLQVLQELAVRIEDEQVALGAEHLRVRVDAAIELVELGVLAESVRIDRSRLRIPVAAQLLCLSVRIRGDDHDLPIGVRANLERALLAGCA